MLNGWARLVKRVGVHCSAGGSAGVSERCSEEKHIVSLQDGQTRTEQERRFHNLPGEKVHKHRHIQLYIATYSDKGHSGYRTSV